MRLSKRAEELGASATMQVAARVAQLRAKGRRVVDLGAGEPDFQSPECALEAVRRALADGYTRYSESAGLPALREALAERYRRLWRAPWQGDSCLITVGAKSALFMLAQALVDTASEVVLAAPDWVTFRAQVRFASGRPVAVPRVAEDGFALRAAPLIAAITEATRAVIICSPCNPTGAVCEDEELSRLAAGCAERGVVLIVDETYERFVYDHRRPKSAAAFASDYPNTVVVVGSFSKTFAMTGWRVGYVLGAAPLIAKLIAIQGHMNTHPTSFAMHGALAALVGAGKEIESRRAELERRRDLVLDHLRRLPGVVCSVPPGAFYVFPQVSATRGFAGSLELADRILLRAGVALVPGVAFAEDHHLRIAYGAAPEVLEEGLAGLAAALAE